MDEMTSLKDRLNELAYRYYVLDDPAVWKRARASCCPIRRQGASAASL